MHSEDSFSNDGSRMLRMLTLLLLTAGALSLRMSVSAPSAACRCRRPKSLQATPEALARSAAAGAGMSVFRRNDVVVPRGHERILP